MSLAMNCSGVMVTARLRRGMSRRTRPSGRHVTAYVVAAVLTPAVVELATRVALQVSGTKAQAPAGFTVEGRRCRPRGHRRAREFSRRAGGFRPPGERRRALGAGGLGRWRDGPEATEQEPLVVGAHSAPPRTIRRLARSCRVPRTRPHHRLARCANRTRGRWRVCGLQRTRARGRRAVRRAARGLRPRARATTGVRRSTEASLVDPLRGLRSPPVAVDETQLQELEPRIIPG